MTDGPLSPGRVTIERYDDARIVSLHGEHDIGTEDLVRERLADARGAAGPIVVDLTAATFIDSFIVAALIDAYRADTPPRLRVVARAGTAPRELFDLVRFEDIAPVFEQLEDALAEHRG